MAPAGFGFTLVLDYPLPLSREERPTTLVERSLAHVAPLGPFAGRATDGPRVVLHSLRSTRGRHSQDPLRLPGSWRHGLREDNVRRARAGPPGAPQAPWIRQDRVPGCRALRGRASGDEPFDLPGHRSHTPWRRRHARVRRASWRGRRRLAAAPGSPVGRARRIRYPP